MDSPNDEDIVLVKDIKIAMEKKIAGEKATDFIKNGMVLGLGTGTTVYYTINKLAEMVRNGLEIRAVSTSEATTDLARKLGIPLVDLNEVKEIDLTIDGADEVDFKFNGIKGGGGALLFESIVASCSRENIWVVDSSKYVETLGKFPLPVEVIPMGYSHLVSKFEANNMKPVVRKKGKDLYITDNGNLLIDLHLDKIENLNKLSEWLNNLPGVIQSGLFINVVDKIVIARGEQVEVISKVK